MKVFFRNIHLYLSLAAGLVIAVLCFTGAVLVFEKELEQKLHPERYFVSEVSSQRLPLQQLVAAVQAQVPKATVTGVKVYANPQRTAEVSLAGEGGLGGGRGGEPGGPGKQEAQGGNSRPSREARPATGPGGEPRQTGSGGAGSAGKSGKGAQRGGEGGRGPTYFVNPYTSQVIGPYQYRDTFFFTMFALHRGMVAGDVGKLVVGISTLLFLFIIGTGLVLWWPASNKILKQRLTVKWDASFKRLNHDLHIVLGFYAALFLFVFAFTGLAWSFQWFNKGIYVVTNSSMERPEPPKSAAAAGRPISLDIAYAAAVRQAPGAESYALQLPRDSAGSLTVRVLPHNAPHEGAISELYLDQHTGQLLGQQAYADRNLGMRVRSSFKPVHTGAIFGWPSKIVAFAVCLLGVTFPVTGVIMWLNRLKKERKKQAMPVVRARA